MAGFSKGQKRIARYILEHYDTAAFMTAYRLGETVGVSESTVVRFAAELGFEGYPQLQKTMQELIRSKLTTLQRIEVTRARIDVYKRQVQCALLCAGLQKGLCFRGQNTVRQLFAQILR